MTREAMRPAGSLDPDAASTSTLSDGPKLSSGVSGSSGEVGSCKIKWM